MSHDEAQEAIQSLIGRAGAARAALRRGETVALSELESRVASLCQAMAAMPDPTARGLMPRLMALLEEVDALRQQLRAGLAILKDQIGDSSERRRAHKAYGRPERAPGQQP